MSIFAITCYISSLLSGITGLLVLSANKNSRLSQAWFLYSASLALWLFGLGGALNVGTKEGALIFQQLLYIGTIFIPETFLLFSAYLIKNETLKKIARYNFPVALLWTATLFWNGLFIQKILDQNSFGYYPVETGPIYYLFLAWFASIIILAFAFLLKARRKEQIPEIKQQISFVFYGNVIAFCAGSLNFLLDFGIAFPPYYNFIVPSYLIFIGYAIGKSRLFGINLILTELLVLFMGAILLVMPFLMPDPWLRTVSLAVFGLFIIIGWLLIRATLREVDAKEILETEVQKRTKELQTANLGLQEREAELTKFYNLTVGRELRMAELKGEIEKLKDKGKTTSAGAPITK